MGARFFGTVLLLSACLLLLISSPTKKLHRRELSSGIGDDDLLCGERRSAPGRESRFPRAQPVIAGIAGVFLAFLPKTSYAKNRILDNCAACQKERFRPKGKYRVHPDFTDETTNDLTDRGDTSYEQGGNPLARGPNSFSDESTRTLDSNDTDYYDPNDWDFPENEHKPCYQRLNRMTGQLEYTDSKDYEQLDPENPSHQDMLKMIDPTVMAANKSWDDLEKEFGQNAATDELDLMNHMMHNDLRMSDNHVTNTYYGDPDNAMIDGMGTNALEGGFGISIDQRNGNLFVLETEENRIRLINPEQKIHFFAGTGEAGWRDGPASLAQFDAPFGITSDTRGNLYVADTYNRKIRKIDTDLVVTTLMDGARPNKTLTDPHCLHHPYGIAVDHNGCVYTSDVHRCMIIKIFPDGTPYHLAGNGGPKEEDGFGTNAGFQNPRGLAVDHHGNLFIGDPVSMFNQAFSYDKVKKIDPFGNVTTFGGNVPSGHYFGSYADGPKEVAEFMDPYALATDPDGNLYVSDINNHVIRKITPQGAAGTFSGVGHLGGTADGESGVALFWTPFGLTYDNRLNRLYAFDSSSKLVRRIDRDANWTIEDRYPEPIKHWKDNYYSWIPEPVRDEISFEQSEHEPF